MSLGTVIFVYYLNIFLWSFSLLVCLFRQSNALLSEKFQFRPFWSILVLIHKNNLITRVSLNQSGILEEAQVFLLCLGLISSITFQFGELGQVSLIFTKKPFTVWWWWRGQIREESNYNVVVSCINNIQHDHNQTTKTDNNCPQLLTDGWCI